MHFFGYSLSHGLSFLRGWRSWPLSVYSGRPRHRLWTVKRTLNLLSFFLSLRSIDHSQKRQKKQNKNQKRSSKSQVGGSTTGGPSTTRSLRSIDHSQKS